MHTGPALPLLALGTRVLELSASVGPPVTWGWGSWARKREEPGKWMGSTCSSGHPVSLPLSSAAAEGHMGSGRWGACLPSGPLHRFACGRSCRPCHRLCFGVPMYLLVWCRWCPVLGTAVSLGLWHLLVSWAPLQSPLGFRALTVRLCLCVPRWGSRSRVRGKELVGYVSGSGTFWGASCLGDAGRCGLSPSLGEEQYP